MTFSPNGRKEKQDSGIKKNFTSLQLDLNEKHKLNFFQKNQSYSEYLKPFFYIKN